MFTIFTKIWGYLRRVAFFHLKLPSFSLLTHRWSEKTVDFNPLKQPKPYFTQHTNTWFHGTFLLSFFHPLFLCWNVRVSLAKRRFYPQTSCNMTRCEGWRENPAQVENIWEPTFFSVRSVRVCDEWPLLERSLNILNVQGLKIRFFLSTCFKWWFLPGWSSGYPSQSLWQGH